MTPPEASLVPVQLTSALEPVLESVLDEALGELTDAAQQADGPVAAGLGGRFPLLWSTLVDMEAPSPWGRCSPPPGGDKVPPTRGPVYGSLFSASSPDPPLAPNSALTASQLMHPVPVSAPARTPAPLLT